MPRSRPLALTALTFLFFAEAQRAYFGSAFALAYDALFPVLDPDAALLAALPLAAVLLPLLPLTRWLERTTAVAVAVAGVAVFRLLMAPDELLPRMLGSALVIGCAGLYLRWGVGLLRRRTVAAGAVLGLVADQLLRLAGRSYDLSLHPSWLPVQVFLSLALLGLAVAWVRSGRREAGGAAAARAADPSRTRAHRERGDDEGGEAPTLERRSGGLRLRGALALGPLLFLDLHVLGLPAVTARWTGTPYAGAALATAAAAGVALGLVLSAPSPARGRPVGVALLVAAAVGVFAGWWGEGWAATVAMATGHGAALLLVARSLQPASGRRGGGVVTAALATLVLATAVYSLTFYFAFTLPILRGGAPWVFAAALVLLAGAVLLLPEPEPRPRLLPPLAGLGAAAAVPALALLVTAGLMRRAADQPAAEDPGREFRVGTYNLHYGFDGDWRFAPHALADALAAERLDVVALQEVPVGVPTAYGVDLPLWLGAATGAESWFDSRINGLLGDAFLTRVPVDGLRSTPLPPDEGDPRQHLELVASIGGRPVTFHAFHLGVEEAEREAQMSAAAPRLAGGPAVVLGDLNTDEPSFSTDRLREAGFVDAFARAGRAAAPTWPADRPAERIDWIWIRGLDAVDARVAPALASDHRLVVATLQNPPGPIR